MIIAMMKETKLQRYQPKMMMMMIIVIIVVDTTGSIDPRGKKQEAKNNHWWLEVRVFVSGTEGVHDED